MNINLKKIAKEYKPDLAAERGEGVDKMERDIRRQKKRETVVAAEQKKLKNVLKRYYYYFINWIIIKLAGNREIMLNVNFIGIVVMIRKYGLMYRGSVSNNYASKSHIVYLMGEDKKSFVEFALDMAKIAKEEYPFIYNDMIGNKKAGKVVNRIMERGREEIAKENNKL